MERPKGRTTGAFLQAARERAGLTMRGLARAVGKDHKHISLLEHDQISPTVETLQQLCRALGVEPWEAVAGMTKAELLASLPVRPASPLHAELDELIRAHGEPAAKALLMAGREVQSEKDLQEVLTIFKVIRARGGA